MRFRPGPAALWFLRHGQTVGNVIRDRAEAEGLPRYDLPTRDADVPLSALGEEQSRAFGRWLGGEPAQRRPEVVVVSPYLRARRTADLVLEAAGAAGARMPREVDDRLRDREMGVWSELTWPGVRAAFPEEAERAVRTGRYFHRPPGGESWADMTLRLRSLLGDVHRYWPGGRVLMVTHDVPIQLAVGVLEGLDEEGVVRLVRENRYANCALSAFEADGDGYRTIAYNRTPPGAPHGGER